MLLALLQMALLIAAGLVWKHVAPKHIAVSSHRRAITDLVFYLLLPALVLDIIWRTPPSELSPQISLLALCGIGVGLLLMWLSLQFITISNKQKGALLLAAAFPNATYLGLPVLTAVLGDYSQAVVVQYDLFACTIVLLSGGMLLAHHYGDHDVEVHPLQELTKIPALWAVAIGLILSFSGIEQPDFLHTSLSTLAGGVVPLMLIVLGMSIRWSNLRLRLMPLLSLVVLISLILVPLTVYSLGTGLGLESKLLTPVTLLAAMPTMIFGIVICERYQLDGEIYAAAVTLTTLTSIVTLPLAYRFLS